MARDKKRTKLPAAERVHGQKDKSNHSGQYFYSYYVVIYIDVYNISRTCNVCRIVVDRVAQGRQLTYNVFNINSTLEARNHEIICNEKKDSS